ncbi:hypothetical protein DFQ26_001471, partial [Actinomortierella ambigua]
APAVEVEVVRPDPGRITKSNVLNILACAAYFGVEELCQQCTTYVVREMVTMEHVTGMTRFCEAHTYFPWTNKIEDACKTFLRRNVWDHPMATCYAVLERLPARWLLEVLASDSLWIPNEWERYKLCRRVVFHRHVLAQCQRHQRRGQRACHVNCRSNVECDGGDGGSSGSSDSTPGPAAADSALDDSGETGSTSDVETLRDSTLPGDKPSAATIDIHDALPDATKKTRAPEDGDDSVDEGLSDEDDDEDDSGESSEDEDEDEDEAIYRVLFSSCIHYMHITFQHLQQIASDVNPATGKPFVESQVVQKAFWQQMELRFLVERSKSDTTDLGIHVTSQFGLPIYSGSSPSPKAQYPSFRFSVEFGGLHELTGAKSAHSESPVFYCGSFWDIEIQKSRPPDANGDTDKLGVYLRRSLTRPDPQTQVPSPASHFPSVNRDSSSIQSSSVIHSCKDGHPCKALSALSDLDLRSDGHGGYETPFGYYTDPRDASHIWFRMFFVPLATEHPVISYKGAKSIKKGS